MCTSENSIFSQHGNHGRRPPRPLPPPIVLRRPFRHDRPLPHSNYNVGYARFFMISSGGAGKTKFLSNHIFKGRIKKYTTIKWVSALPPVIRRPFQRDRPLTYSNSNVGYARFLMISSGGTGKTKFPSIIFLRGESEKKLDNQIGLQRRPRSYSVHSGAIDPFPKVSPTPGMLVCL
jgi:hypothetical protein